MKMSGKIKLNGKSKAGDTGTMPYNAVLANPTSGPNWKIYGYGSNTVGGSVVGRTHLIVDTLNDMANTAAMEAGSTTAADLAINKGQDGFISFREAWFSTGPRLITFAVSGNIELVESVSIDSPPAGGPFDNVTIDGGDAPNGGICFKNWDIGIRQIKECIFRYIRFRPGPQVLETDLAPVTFSDPGSHEVDNIVFDHCSFSWATDELIGIFNNCSNVTLQHSFLTEPLNDSIHSEGIHPYGPTIGNGASRVTLYQCYINNTNQRGPFSMNPKAGTTPMFLECIGCVTYNWNIGAELLTSTSALGDIRLDLIRNYWKKGPSYTVNRREIEAAIGGANWLGTGTLYFEGNLGPHRQSDSDPQTGTGIGFTDTLTDDLLSGTRQCDGTPDVDLPISALIAFTDVLENSGAVLPRRDSVDTRGAVQANSGTAFTGTSGSVVNHPDDVGGWPDLT